MPRSSKKVTHSAMASGLSALPTMKAVSHASAIVDVMSVILPGISASTTSKWSVAASTMRLASCANGIVHGCLSRCRFSRLRFSSASEISPRANRSSARMNHPGYGAARSVRARKAFTPNSLRASSRLLMNVLLPLWGRPPMPIALTCEKSGSWSPASTRRIWAVARAVRVASGSHLANHKSSLAK